MSLELLVGLIDLPEKKLPEHFKLNSIFIPGDRFLLRAGTEKPGYFFFFFVVCNKIFQH